MDIKEEIIKEKNSSEEELVEFFSMMLGSKIVTHVHHLQCTGKGSYAKHIALGEFYDKASDIADVIIETYQGFTGSLVKYNAEDLSWGIDETPFRYLEILKETICEGREIEVLKKSSNLQNEIDNFITLIDQTLYKLGFLE